MDELTNLLAGAQINKQHPYFDMAKADIYKLALQYTNYKEYDNSALSLITNIKLLEPDLYHLNIVIQYIITYGNQLFDFHIKQQKIDSYNKYVREDYVDKYIEELSSMIR